MIEKLSDEEIELKYEYDNYNNILKLINIDEIKILFIFALIILIFKVNDYAKIMIFVYISGFYILIPICIFLIDSYKIIRDNYIMKKGLKINARIQRMWIYRYRRNRRYDGRMVVNVGNSNYTNYDRYVIKGIKLNNAFNSLLKYFEDIENKRNTIQPEATIDVYIYNEKIYADLKSVNLRNLEDL